MQPCRRDTWRAPSPRSWATRCRGKDFGSTPRPCPGRWGVDFAPAGGAAVSPAAGGVFSVRAMISAANINNWFSSTRSRRGPYRARSNCSTQCCNWRSFRSRSTASPSSPITICRKAAGSLGSWWGLISTGVFLLRPLGLFALDFQVHPFVHQFPEALVVGHLLLHPLDPFQPHETRRALPPPGVAQLIVGPMLLRLLGIFAAARGLPAHVVLLPQAARMHRPQVGQPVLERFDSALDFSKINILYHNRAIGLCQQKNASFRKKYSGSTG